MKNRQQGWEGSRRPATLSARIFLMSLLFAAGAGRTVLRGADRTGQPSTIYVNNVIGNDAWSGTTPAAGQDEGVGPVRTIKAGLRKAATGGTVSIARTEVHYREGVRIEGFNKGRPATPLIIEGNGATVTGLVAAKPEQWVHLEEDIYWFEAKQEDGSPAAMPNSNWLGFYRHEGWFDQPQSPKIFFLDGKPSHGVKSLEALTPGEFFYETQARRRLYLRLPQGKTIDAVLVELPLNSGIFVSDDYVVVRNLSSIYSQDDGWAGFWGIGLVLENINGSYNCDQGISFHGFSTSTIDGALFEYNGGAGIVDVMRCISIYRNCIVRNNLIAGALLKGQAHKLLNCAFYGNGDVGNRGGAQVVSDKGTSTSLEHCLFRGDEAIAGETGVSIFAGSVYHCTFVGLENGLAVGGGATVSNSIFQNCSASLISTRPEATLTLGNSLLDLGTIQLGKRTINQENWSAFCEEQKAFGSNRTGTAPLAGPWLQLPADSPLRTAGSYGQTMGAALPELTGYDPDGTVQPDVAHP